MAIIIVLALIVLFWIILSKSNNKDENVERNCSNANRVNVNNMESIIGTPCMEGKTNKDHNETYASSSTRNTEENYNKHNAESSGNISDKNYKSKKENSPTSITNKPTLSEMKAYTVVSVPFLADVFDIDYTKRIYFNYELENSQKLVYPLVRVPQKGTEIKLPVHGRNGKRGVCEQKLCERIKAIELNGFFDNLTVFAAGYPFEPDVAYVDVNKGIFIDIEVDEPYSGWERIPIHCRVKNSTADDYRNRSFTERGWIVLRFSERQIVEQCDSCLKFTMEFIKRMDRSIKIPAIVANASDLKEDDMWTKAVALKKIAEKEREKMLGIGKFISSSMVAQSKLVDYNGSRVIEEQVKAQKEEYEWKTSSKQGKYQEYIDKYPKGTYVDSAKKNLDRALWEECKKLKQYDRYVRETKLGDFVPQTTALKAEEQRILEENRRIEQVRLKAIQDEEERKKKEDLAEQQRRDEEERKRKEAQKYERRQVSTVHSTPKTPSSRGYA